jgi:hypothetical protein
MPLGIQLLIALGIVMLLVAATLRVLWWFWTEHEEAVVRERLRQRAQGGDKDFIQWLELQRQRKERGDGRH